MKLKLLAFASKHCVNRYCSTQIVRSCLISQETHQEYRNTTLTVLDKTLEGFDLPVKHKLKQLAEHSLNKDSLRAAFALLAYQHFEKPERVTNESLVKMRALAWGTEVVNSYFTILDENMNKNDGLQYVSNDASLLRSLLYEMVKKNFVGHACYTDIVDIFDKAILNTSIGLYLDSITVNPKSYTEEFTTNRYNSIVDHKAYATFKLPVKLAMLMTRRVDKFSLLRVDGVCTDIGRLAQIQRDFVNCYGDVDISGPKSDIRTGKCTWLALAALQRCNAAQRTVFTACYGSAEPAHIERIKRLYDQLELSKLFKEQQKMLKDGILAKSQGLANAFISPEPFIRILKELSVDQPQK